VCLGVLCLMLCCQTVAAKPRPEVTIDPGGIPPAALRAIAESVDAIARLSEDEDGGEETRLRRRAYDATVSALATLGYFTPAVALTVGEDVIGETWDIVIEPGPRAEVGSVDIRFVGRLAQPDYAERVQMLRDGWTLPAGRPFINADWSNAKSALLSAVNARDFYLAYLAHTQAVVDPETAQVALTLEVHSGPRVHMGERIVSGLKHVPEKLIDRYVRYTSGDVYRRDQLEAWEQGLQSTAFFRGAFVTLQRDSPPTEGEAEPDPAHEIDLMARDEATLPIFVRVSESQPKRVEASLGVDDDVGPKAEITYRQNVVFAQPVTLETGLGLDRKRQRAYLDLHLPPTLKGQKDSIGVLADRSDILGLEVTRLALGATRLYERKGAGDSRVEYETRMGVLAATDHVRIAGNDSYSMPSLTSTVEWLRRDVNSRYDPREGNLLVGSVGLGMTLDNARPFLRSRLRTQKWWPIGPRDVLTLRGEVGKIWSDSATRVPDDFGFRTGGARSLRGYKYQRIGRELGDAIVGASTLVVASIEYMHYFDDTFGMAVFVDAGDAAQSFTEMKMALGYGLGLRARTPAGPLFLDLAYGQRARDVRLHLSLGIAF